ncbi:hypothetical protein Ac2012v2_007924 [Leucoagaricus gongylophorus]
MPRTSSASLTAQVQQQQLTDAIDQYELPKSLVSKIAKSALPNHVKLQKDTVLALVKSSTVFVNYLAAIAHDVATSKQHKSISANDILHALDMIEFGHLSPLLNEQYQAWLSEKSRRANSNMIRPPVSTEDNLTSPFTNEPLRDQAQIPVSAPMEVDDDTPVLS